MTQVAPAGPARIQAPGGLDRTAQAGRAETGKAGPLNSFADLIDVINPLQHIPGVAELYRTVTGDQISEGARYAGNALYGLALGGPVGLSVMTAYSIAGHAVNEWQQGAGDGLASAPVETRPAPPAGEMEPKDHPGSASVAVPGQPVLGEQTGKTLERVPGTPVRLSDLVHGNVSLNVPQSDRPREGTAPDKGQVRDDLATIASHRANHLPIDVLKTLQERHLANADNDPA
jgi:hypothetical protein